MIFFNFGIVISQKCFTNELKDFEGFILTQEDKLSKFIQTFMIETDFTENNDSRYHSSL